MHSMISAGRRLVRTRFIGLLAAIVFLPALVFAETRVFDLDGFDGLSASSGIHVIVDVGAEAAVIAESDDDAQLDRLEIDVRRGTLRIRMDQGLFSLRRERGWRITVRVSMPELIRVDAASGALVDIDQMAATPLSSFASSGARIELAALRGATISAVVSSGSQIATTSGDCEVMDAVASDGSNLNLAGVVRSDVNATSSSGSSVRVHADQRIYATASSGASNSVHGAHQDMEIHASSGGTIDFP